MAEALTAANAKFKYTEYPEVGHNSGTMPTRSPSCFRGCWRKTLKALTRAVSFNLSS
jgi:hypothetical protein